MKNLLLGLMLVTTPVYSQLPTQGSNEHYLKQGSDGYVFETKEYNHPDIHIQFIFHKSLKDLNESYTNTTSKHRVKAYSILKPDLCIIHTVDPSVDYEPEYIGHEVMHCVFGRWHS